MKFLSLLVDVLGAMMLTNFHCHGAYDVYKHFKRYPFHVCIYIPMFISILYLDDRA